MLHFIRQARALVVSRDSALAGGGLATWHWAIRIATCRCHRPPLQQGAMENTTPGFRRRACAGLSCRAPCSWCCCAHTPGGAHTSDGAHTPAQAPGEPEKQIWTNLGEMREIKRKDKKRKEKREGRKERDGSGCLKCAGVVCPAGA